MCHVAVARGVSSVHSLKMVAAHLGIVKNRHNRDSVITTIILRNSIIQVPERIFLIWLDALMLRSWLYC
jgi:Trm5-related predicted tRNA methylase